MAEMGDVHAESKNLEEETEEGIKVLSMRFEKQSNQLVVGTNKGYRLVSYAVPQKPIVKRGLECWAITFIELIPKTYTLVYVTDDDPEEVNFYDYEEGTENDSKTYEKPIVGLRTACTRVAVAVESGIYLYSCERLKIVVKLHYVIFEVPNPNGLLDLSENDFNAYMAYPCRANSGEVEIFDCRTMKSKVIFQAHISPIVAISFSPTGRSLATASEKGTLIRVHIVFTGECVYEFRRSFVRPTSINSLNFGLDSTFLGVTSSSTTIHIFKLEQGSLNSPGSGALLDVIIRSADNYLPSRFTKFLHQERAFAVANLPVPGMDTITTIHKTRTAFFLIVATYDGIVYIYALDDVKGGECPLIQTLEIDFNSSDTSELKQEWVFVDEKDEDDDEDEDEYEDEDEDKDEDGDIQPTSEIL